MKNLRAFLLISASLILSLSFISLKIPKNINFVKTEKMQQDSVKWVAPASANDLVNPTESNDANIATALVLYKKLCRSCHGRNGDGEGVEAEDLETTTTDFTNPSFVEQTDGSMFYKISEGRNDMESFKEKLKEEEIWLVILYIKTFSTVTEE